MPIDCAFTHCSALTALKLPESVKSIGRYAFLGCSSLTSVRLPEGIEAIGDYAFTSLNNATFYTSADKEENAWGSVWNASFRPVFWNCVFSDEGYLLYFEKTESNVSNFHSAAVFAPPEREGYSFLGWATSQNSSAVVYTLEQTAKVPDGTVLYAVWMQNA